MRTLLDIGSELIAARRARGMTQRELGAAVGATQQQVARWEAGDYAQVALGRLARVAEVLGVGVESAHLAAEAPAAYGVFAPPAPARDLGDAIARLRASGPELRERFGVTGISVYGSFATGEQGPDSDVDLLVEFGPGRRGRLVDLAVWLERDVLGRAADVTETRLLRWEIADDVAREAVRVWSA